MQKKKSIGEIEKKKEKKKKKDVDEELDEDELKFREFIAAAIRRNKLLK